MDEKEREILLAIYKGKNIEKTRENTTVLENLYFKGHIDGEYCKPRGYNQEIFQENCLTRQGLGELKNLGLVDEN